MLKKHIRIWTNVSHQCKKHILCLTNIPLLFSWNKWPNLIACSCCSEGNAGGRCCCCRHSGRWSAVHHGHFQWETMEATHGRVKDICNHNINNGMGCGRYHSNKPCDVIMMNTPGCNTQSQSVQSHTAWNAGKFWKRKGKH